MKARALQKRLGTSRTVHEENNCICVASSYVPDLIKVHKETLFLSYALDTFNKGRASLNSEELRRIWDSLSEMCKSGEIKEYFDGEDIIENALPVFYDLDGKVVEGVTDQYGWPNVTADGVLMYDNSFFKSRKEAESYLHENLTGYIEILNDRIKDRNEEILNCRKKIADAETKLAAISI